MSFTCGPKLLEMYSMTKMNEKIQNKYKKSSQEFGYFVCEPLLSWLKDYVITFEEMFFQNLKT